MPGAKNKQHFVPQCYLSSFADSNRRLYVFDKFERRSYKAHVKDIAQKHRFYDFPQISDDDTPVDDDVVFSLNFKEDMPDPQIVEKIFAKLEEDYATAMRTLQQTIIQRKPLSPEQKYIFSHFIAVQWRRTPEHRRTIIELLEKISTKVWEMKHKEQKTSFKYDPKYASLVQTLDMFDPFVNDKLIQVLMSHIWIIGLNTSDVLLYTSDQPVVKMSRGEMQGFGSPGIQITLPLTPRNVLLLCDRNTFPFLTSMGYEDKYIDLDGEAVKHYNSLQVRDSDRHIFSQNGDFLFAIEYSTKHLEVGKPKEHHVNVS